MKKLKLVFILLMCCGLISCDKEFLNERPAKALLVPTTLSDFQALLDNHGVMNTAPNLNTVSSDDFFSTDNGILSASAVNRNAYLWADDLYEGAYIVDWSVPYQQIFYANVVLDGLNEMSASVKATKDWEQMRGNALFYRAYAMANMVQLFAPPYSPATAEQMEGLPLKLSSDVNDRPGRASLKKTYDQIIQDLKEAEKALPDQSTYKSRPSRSAALALLARLFLSMGNYQEAEIFAASCLQLNNKLLDYNTLNLNILNAANPFPQALQNLNEEVIFYSLFLTNTFFLSTLTQVDTLLSPSYHPNDLRRSAFFVDRGKGVINMRGSYTGNVINFSGLAVDEVYLIRAECYARKGKTAEAMNDLNSVLSKRWKKGTFVPFTSSDLNSALQLVLTERRKELIGRGLRWSDLRRLNSDSRFATTLKRVVAGKTYTLLPGSNRYTLSLPDAEISGSGIRQNPR